jgi:outer membrane protein
MRFPWSYQTRLPVLRSALALAVVGPVWLGNLAVAAEQPQETLPLTNGVELEEFPTEPESVDAEPVLPPETAPADPGPGATFSGQTVNLTLPDLLNLTLQGNRNLRNNILERIVQRQQLNAAEQTFAPRFTPILRVDVTQNLAASGVEIVDSDNGQRLFGNGTDVDDQALLNTTLTTRLGTDIAVGVDPLNDSQPLRLRVEQPLLRGFGQAVNEAPVDQVRLQERQNQLALQGTAITTLTIAITRYTNLINAQSQVAIQAQALERRQRELEIQRALVEAGRRARLDLFETERSVADAERDLINAQNQLQQANNVILNLIGTDRNLRFVASEETVTQLFGDAVARAEAYDQDQLVALALAQRADYRQAQLQRQQLELQQLLAEDALRWQLNAVADGNLGNFSETTVGLVATRTFDDPSLETARVSSEVALRQQDNTLAQLEETIRNDVIASLANVQSNQLRVQAAERATTNARRQLEVAREQFRLGRGNVTQFQLLDQEDQLVQAQSEELAARVAFLNGIAELEQTVGVTLESWAEQVDLAPVLREVEE